MSSVAIPAISKTGSGHPDEPLGPSNRPLHLGQMFIFIRYQALPMLLVSLLLLVPCFWQSHIAAGDLLSHTYNAWLASLIQQGKAPGVRIAQQHTNVLFDLLLSSLFSRFGPIVAERTAAAVAVLLFFWGAFATAAALSGKAPWFLTPCMAMLAYGWVFQMGFFNYYLSLGLSLLAFALLWSGRWWDTASAIPLLALSWLGQPLPVLWVVGIAVYVWVARRLTPRHRVFLLVASCAGVFALGQLVRHFGVAVWEWRQAFYISGADQVTVFRKQYLLVFIGVLVVWGSALLKAWRQRGLGVTLEISLQLYALSVAACVLLPDSVTFAWFKAPFGGATQRLSLAAAVLMCGFVASVKPARWQRLTLVVLTLFYFGFLYQDARSFDLLEAKVAALLDRIPSGQRVIADFDRPHFRSYDLNMLLDHACIGRCFSYGNYEASTEAFRIRANSGNTIVVWTGGPGLARRLYFEAQSEQPLYQVYACGNGLTDVCMRVLKL